MEARKHHGIMSRQLIGLIDFDGTLFETESIYDEAMDDLFSRHGHDTGGRKHVDYKHDVADKYGIMTGTGWRIILPSTVHYLTGETLTADESERLVGEFTDIVLRLIHDDPHDMYPASAMFCERVLANGGRLALHTGTEPEICKALLSASGHDWFDAMESSHILRLDGEYTRYKKRLLTALMDDCIDADGGDPFFFVYGDSNGDGFAAKELGLPFVMARTHDAPYTMGLDGAVLSPGMSITVDGDGDEVESVLNGLLTASA